jgi:hypothetical protein
MEFVLTKSFKQLNVDWVKIDPSRVLQVLINLTTNAIKFTTTEETRTIKVILSASREKPSAKEAPTVSYFPMRAKRTDQTFGPDWGDGEEIFLEFAVQDTGRGLTPEEKKLLFQRFSQASPRTHVQYGGSGLGLFISRELTELQGGEIGVSSEAGVGSTFAFYVKCRRSSEPQETLDVLPSSSISRKVSNAKDKGRAELPGLPKIAPKIKDFATVPSKEGVASKAKPQKRELKVLIVEDNLGMSSAFPMMLFSRTNLLQSTKKSSNASSKTTASPRKLQTTAAKPSKRSNRPPTGPHPLPLQLLTTYPSSSWTRRCPSWTAYSVPPGSGNWSKKASLGVMCLLLRLRRMQGRSRLLHCLRRVWMMLSVSLSVLVS